MSQNIYQGVIVWVRLGPRGQYKERPAVVLCKPNNDGDLAVVAGTTRFTKPLRNEEVEIPAGTSPDQPHPLTKLRYPTVANCTWVQKINETEILNVGGHVPRTVMEKIDVKIRAYLAAKRRP